MFLRSMASTENTNTSLPDISCCYRIFSSFIKLSEGAKMLMTWGAFLKNQGLELVDKKSQCLALEWDTSESEYTHFLRNPWWFWVFVAHDRISPLTSCIAFLHFSVSLLHYPTRAFKELLPKSTMWTHIIISFSENPTYNCRILLLRSRLHHTICCTNLEVCITCCI